MANEHSKLSKFSTEMFNDILEEMKNRNCNSVTVPFLLWGILGSSTEGSVYCDLENYLFSTSDSVYPSEIEDVTSLLIANSENDDSDEEDKKGSKNSPKKDSKPDSKAKSNKIEKQTLLETFRSKIPSMDSAKSWFNSQKKNTSQDPKGSETETPPPEVTTILTFTTHEGKELQVPVNDEVRNIVEKMLETFSKFNIETLEPLHFTIGLFIADSKDLKQFFRDLDSNYDSAKKHFDPKNILVCGLIPFQLSSFLHTLNERIDGSSPCEILCRDKEAEQIWNICLKKNKRNTVIVGEAGVGKTALIEKLTHDINSGNCPEQFKKHKVVVLDVNSLIAGTSYRGDAEERINDIIKFLETHDDVILFIDEVHTILGAGSCFEGEMDLANALKPILARGDTIVIGATTEAEYKKYFSKDAALSRRFEKVVVEEPMFKDVYPMIKNKLLSLTKFHGVTISKELIEYSIMIASCFAFEKKNPDKTLDLIDRAMVTAKRAGKTAIDKDCILKNFGIYFEMWDHMSLDTRKEVAYHEAGHYIVGKASGRLTQYNWLAISIMPAEHYLGVTVYEVNDKQIPFCNTDYFIDDIAHNLGGRVAEYVFRKDFTSGASADLESATKRAFQLVTKLGMGNDSIKNRVYLNTECYPMFTEKSLGIINDEVNKVIQKAYDRANQLITENNDILEAIVAALLENRIMSEAELDTIWKEVVNNRTHK